MKYLVRMLKRHKKIVKLNTYKKKFHWQALVKAFKQGFNNKPIDLKFYKIEKNIDKYCNNNRISAFIIIITIIACLLIWHS